MKRILYTLWLGMLCFLATPGNLSAADEARYGLVSEEWTLNPDGSREYRYQMELTLFTHTAMNNTYGETFIAYDPKYQQLKINEAYTKQKDGTIIRTPENAFVEVLPSYAADAAYYNRFGPYRTGAWCYHLFGLHHTDKGWLPRQPAGYFPGTVENIACRRVPAQGDASRGKRAKIQHTASKTAHRTTEEQ